MSIVKPAMIEVGQSQGWPYANNCKLLMKFLFKKHHVCMEEAKKKRKNIDACLALFRFFLASFVPFYTGISLKFRNYWLSQPCPTATSSDRRSRAACVELFRFFLAAFIHTWCLLLRNLVHKLLAKGQPCLIYRCICSYYFVWYTLLCNIDSFGTRPIPMKVLHLTTKYKN